jgi:TonB family protein
MKINNKDYFYIFIFLSLFLHGLILYSFNYKTESIPQEALTVNIKKIIPNLPDEDKVNNYIVKPKEIESAIKDRKNFQKKMIDEIKKNSTQIKNTPKEVTKKIINIDADSIQSSIKELLNDNKNNRSQEKTRLITSKTKDREYKSYFEVWKRKVERIGALNYPKAARNGINEILIMTVTLNKDGEVMEIKINKSSGIADLDNSAKNIVLLGSPYAKFPENIKNEVDNLKIRRVWRFANNLGD